MGEIKIIGTRVTNKKKPISPDMIRKLVDISNLDNLLELRNVCVFLLAYAGFFRIEEALLRGESRVVQVICRNHSNFFQTLFLSSLLLFTKSIIFLVLLFIMKKKTKEKLFRPSHSKPSPSRAN